MQLDIRDLQDAPLPLAVVEQAAHGAAHAAGLKLDRLSLVFMDDEQIADINRRFRGVDGPTDVIAFEAVAQAEEEVGEVIISVQTAARQAQEAGHEPETELAWLVAHGVLHVAGLDDETREARARMLNLQRDIIGGMGLTLAS